jgi:hypothetical protein
MKTRSRRCSHMAVKANRHGERVCLRCKAKLDEEMIAQAMFWWGWGAGWARAPRAEKAEYLKSARAFLRGLRGKRA